MSKQTTQQDTREDSRDAFRTVEGNLNQLDNLNEQVKQTRAELETQRLRLTGEELNPTPEGGYGEAFNWESPENHEVGDETLTSYSQSSRDEMAEMEANINAINTVLESAEGDRGNQLDRIKGEFEKLGERRSDKDTGIDQIALEETRMPQSKTEEEMLDWIEDHRPDALDWVSEYEDQISEKVREVDQEVQEYGQAVLDEFREARDHLEEEIAVLADAGGIYELADNVQEWDELTKANQTARETAEAAQDNIYERTESIEELYDTMVQMAEDYAEVAETVHEFQDYAPDSADLDSLEILGEMVTTLDRSHEGPCGETVYEGMEQKVRELSEGAYDDDNLGLASVDERAEEVLTRS
jgi:hypothetical protein